MSEKAKNKYNKLLWNTMILGLGVFGSKILVFLMMPLYTGILSPEEYSLADLIAQTSNLLIPLACVGISDGVFRFSMDREANRSAVLASGMSVLLVSSAVFLLLSPLIGLVNYFSSYAWLIALYVLMANFHTLLAQYVRACNRTRLFSLQGILNTVFVIALNLLFLVAFRMGVEGYVLSVVIADALTAIFLLWFGGVFREIHFRAARLSLMKKMLRYSLPLIPATVFWWITGVSDRYMVTYYCGGTTNGLYSAAYKIPTLLTLVSGVFMEAWQYSAVSESNVGEKRETERFFGNVFTSYQSLLFCACTCIIALSQPLISILCADSYAEAWRYVPILTLSAVFSGFTSFVGSIYLVKKKSVLTFLTAMSGALVNIFLNFLFIPKLGAQGAAIATVASYMVVFLIRVVNTEKRYVKICTHPLHMGINFLLLIGQTVLLLYGNPRLIPISQVIFCLLVLSVNASFVIKGIRLIFGAWRRPRRRAPSGNTQPLTGKSSAEDEKKEQKKHKT